MQHIHIIGVCGTFMGGVAELAQQMGYRVSGSDQQIYPPMSDQLAKSGIELIEGYDPNDIPGEPDCYLIGNALSRGNPSVEYILEHDLPYTSGPQWLAESLLRDRWVIAVAGTHGKTTTASMIAWILSAAGLEPGYLIGGVPSNFQQSAQLGAGQFFVMEADEYDTAFFDKQSKFMHYRPRTLVLNNLEFDHADIFADLEAISRQFQYLIRTVPPNGLIISADDDPNLTDVLERGCWTALETFSLDAGEWSAQLQQSDGSHFRVTHSGQRPLSLQWDQLGIHNVKNALAALAAANHCGVDLPVAIEALQVFQGVKRRLELRGVVGGVTVYDDFAHHPTAIQTTLSGLRQHIGQHRLLAIIEFASNSMRTGVHNDDFLAAIEDADMIFLAHHADNAEFLARLEQVDKPIYVYPDVDAIVSAACEQAKPADHIIVMSNKSFGNIHEKLLTNLSK